MWLQSFLLFGSLLTIPLLAQEFGDGGLESALVAQVPDADSAPIVSTGSHDYYDLSPLERYSDPPQERSTAIAVSTLTAEGILEGNPDGTIRSGAFLNRAEFVSIILRIAPSDIPVDLACFPDIDPDAWYAGVVCHAKALGYVRGYALPDVDPAAWPFGPEKAVLYAEAVKILAEVFGWSIPEGEGEQWYVPYLDAAQFVDVALPEGPGPGRPLTRGAMARLTTRFLAHYDGKLPLLTAALRGDPKPEEPPAPAPDIATGTGDTTGSGASTSSAPATPVVFDTHGDTSVRSSFLLMGEPSAVLGGASVFSDAQPLQVRQFIIRLVSPSASVDAFLVYDHDTRLLGTARLDSPGGKQYVLSRSSDPVLVPKEKEYSFYVRALTKTVNAGGVSGEIVQVDRLGVSANGFWDQKTQSQFSSQTYPKFQTAAAVISQVSNPLLEEDILISGPRKRLGSFRVEGIVAKDAGNADLRITQLNIGVDQTGGIGLSNVWLTADSTDELHACNYSGSEILCSAIPASLGSLEDRPRTLTLYGDVNIVQSNKATLRLVLRQAGAPLANGSVRWTDGTTTFIWVKGESPLVRSTLYVR